MNRWVAAFYEKLHAQNKLSSVSLSQFIQWFDVVGLQRHIKVLGIFSRLYLRDGKPHYMKHMPRIMQYVLEVTSKYDIFVCVSIITYKRACCLKCLIELARQNINLETEVKVA